MLIHSTVCPIFGKSAGIGGAGDWAQTVIVIDMSCTKWKWTGSYSKLMVWHSIRFNHHHTTSRGQHKQQTNKTGSQY